MKRFNIVFIMISAIAYGLVCPIANSDVLPRKVSAGYAFFIIGAFLFYVFLYPKYLRHKMRVLEKKKGSACLPIYADFFFYERYLLDYKSGKLIGLFHLNPFHFQYLDTGEIQDIEIVRNTLGKASVCGVILRIRLEKKTFPIILHRSNRYDTSVGVGTKEDENIMKYAELVKNELLRAGESQRNRKKIVCT